MIRLGDRLGVLLDPRFWMRTRGVSHAWSDTLELLLDEVAHERATIEVGEHYAKIADVRVWISNWPYAYGSMQDRDDVPRRSTALRLRDTIYLETAKQALAKGGKS